MCQPSFHSSIASHLTSYFIHANPLFRLQNCSSSFVTEETIKVDILIFPVFECSSVSGDERAWPGLAGVECVITVYNCTIYQNCSALIGGDLCNDLYIYTYTSYI